MKIAFDCSLVPGEAGGIGQYSRNLARALSKIDSENSYTLYILFPAFRRLTHPEDRKVDLPNAGNFRVVFKGIPVPFQFFRYLQGPGLPRSFREYGLGDIDADVVHSNTFCVPRFRDRKKKLIVTVYDLTVLTHPECHRKANIRHCLDGIKDAIKYADAIVAISESTKADLIKYLDAPPGLITVTHLAAGDDLRPVEDIEVLKSARLKYSLPERYVLFVGSNEPRKNIKTLLEAYALLPAGIKNEFPLVIAGGRGWLNSAIPGVIKRLGLDGAVRFAGYIGRDDMSAVYSGASVFAYPSLYEGFGLPILEAMSCGAPVITSNVSSMPEVAGDAARLVTPTDTGGLGEALSALLVDEGLRKEMRLKGLERAAMFSWGKCARETLALYRKVAG
ncbi:MAG: hypothetical protein A2X93_06900 [Deltaproteobacteria bacterium GWC2_56_8]|nr:MAG: hypothetical protein A2X99_00500 [Deltaproteobacteria bacterium GWB2_55_19]OGP34797.1 MAG: hypothetical protein A2X93_06900 [Deltaproteobacteria bacterium GWC2_56_8]HAO93101.1 glycosyltransferase family 1 protein [Deltaproteobacteria bacterium]